MGVGGGGGGGGGRVVPSGTGRVVAFGAEPSRRSRVAQRACVAVFDVERREGGKTKTHWRGFRVRIAYMGLG